MTDRLASDFTKPNHLRFNTHYDALDHIDKLVEDSNRRLRVDKINPADDYARGKGHLIWCFQLLT